MDTPQILFATVTVFFRAIGLITILPFGDGVMGTAQRIGLAAGIALCFGPHATVGADLVGRSPAELSWMIALAEFCIGILIGLPLAIICECAASWGELFDLTRGQNMAAIFDPANGQSSSTVATMMRYGCITLLFGAGVLTGTIIGFGQSLVLIPPGSVSSLDLMATAQSVLVLIAAMLRGLFSSFLPLAVVFICVEIAFGVLSKTRSGLAVAAESFTVKTVLGILVLAGLLRVVPFDEMARAAAPPMTLLSTLAEVSK